MDALKTLGTIVLGFLLFLALSIFSLAYMLHSTILSSDFVTKQVDKLDIASIAPDLSENLIGDEMPEEAKFLKDVALDVIASEEPWIKEQLDYAIDTGYSFFLGKSDTLTITVPLVELKQDLGAALWDATRNYLKKEFAAKSESQINDLIQDFAGQIPEDIIPPELAALSQDERNTVIEQYLRELGGLELNEAIPAEISSQFESLMKEYFDQFYAEFIGDMPDSYTVDEGTVGADTMDTLFTVRKYIGYFQTAYIWLIVFMVVIAGLIFLINRDVKVTTRALGIDLLIFGILDVGGAIVARSLSPMKFIPNMSDIPVSVQNIIDGVYKDVASIALTFSIGVLAVGVMLLVVSFIVKSKEATPKEAEG